MKSSAAIGDRIKYVRTSLLGLSQDAFAERLGQVTRGAVGNWERGKGVKRENVELIADTFDISYEWLAANRGEKPPPPNWESLGHDADRASTSSVSDKQVRAGIPLGNIPEIDVVAGMGGGGLTAQAVTSINGITFSAEVIRDHWRLPQWVLNRWHAQAPHVAVLPCQGDSMYPTIDDGEPIFVDTRHRVPSPPGIYALADEFGGVVVKRLEVISRPGEEPVIVRVSSDNEKHQPRELTLPEIYIIGRYLGRLTV